MEQMVLVYLDGLVREGIRGEIMLGGELSFSVLPYFVVNFLSLRLFSCRSCLMPFFMFLFVLSSYTYLSILLLYCVVHVVYHVVYNVPS